MWWQIKEYCEWLKLHWHLKNNLLTYKHQKHLNCQNILELKGTQFDPVSDPK